MEALIAAVYLDGGLEAARAVFDNAWRDALEAATGEQNLEAKTALQEWAMARALPLPCYTVISRVGPDHAPVFTVEVSVQGCPPATANGSSLREAEKAAAQVLLTREGVS